MILDIRMVLVHGVLIPANLVNRQSKTIDQRLLCSHHTK